MNLGDYIGDTRTDSLPPGFLKSIKIKYRHEASRVFAGLVPYSRQSETTKHCENVAEISQSKDGSGEEDGKNVDEENGSQNVPSFMSWRVPSRLLNQKCEKTLPCEQTENSKAKSASSISRRSTATTGRSLTSITLKRSKRSAGQKEPEAKIESKSQVKENDPRTKSSKSGKGLSESKHSYVEDKQREGNGKTIKSANSKILKPLTFKPKIDNGLALKDHLHNKTESRENFPKKLDESKAAANINPKRASNLNPSQNLMVVGNSKEQGFNDNAEVKVEDIEGPPEDGSKKLNAEDIRVVGTRRFPKRSSKDANDIKELAKLKGSLPKCHQNDTLVQENDNALPMLKAPETRASVKLSQTPERMDKIYNWMKNSNRREQEAAFNLLSAFNNSEKIQAKTPKKKERVRIALEVLERRRIPDSIKPLRLNNIKPNPTTTRLDKNSLQNYSNHVSKREKKDMQTWHHTTMYHHVPISNNRSALFVQPFKAYQRHFSIHPEWGLHTRVKFSNSLTT